MAYLGSPRQQGAVNNATVTCPNCGTTNYVIRSKVASMGGRKCFACKKEHK